MFVWVLPIWPGGPWIPGDPSGPYPAGPSGPGFPFGPKKYRLWLVYWIILIHNGVTVIKHD